MDEDGNKEDRKEEGEVGADNMVHNGNLHKEDIRYMADTMVMG
jgi:hypothetical protein